MKNRYQVRYASSPKDVKNYDTERLREEFLIQNIMEEDMINLVYSQYDRFITGGVVPVSKKVELLPIDPLKADYFLERRELGVINVGGKGTVSVNGEKFELDYKEALYVGRGNEKVVFESTDSENPAKYYLNSTNAHKEYPTKKIGQSDAEVVELGSLETSNDRTIRKLIVNSVVETCQLQIGMTS